MKSTGIREKVKFYNWFAKLGGNLSQLEVENLNLTKPVFIRSSFKKRAEQIKEQHNYKFPKLFKLTPLYMEVNNPELFVKKDFVVQN